MNEKLLNLYDRCMKHNISISIKYLLSDSMVEVQGKTLLYNKAIQDYDLVKLEKLISIEEARLIDVDLLEHTINEIFYELIDKKGECNGNNIR